MEERCVFNMTESQASGVAYVFGWVSGIVMLVAEPRNKTVKFSALQSIIVFGALSIIETLLGWLTGIPFLGWLFGIAAGLVGFVTLGAWLYLMVSAFTGKTVSVPVIGEVCKQQVNK